MPAVDILGIDVPADRPMFVVFATVMVMGLLRGRHDRHLLVIATAAAGRGGFSRLLTGFHVANGPQLPLWVLSGSGSARR